MPGLVNPGGGNRSGAPKASAAHIGRLKDVVRSVQRIDADAPVLVQQLLCTEPGCPPLETIVAVLGPPRRTWKFPLPADDLSPEQLRAAIVDHPKGSIHADHH